MSSCLLHLCLLLPFQVLFEFSVHTLHPLLLGKGQSTMNPRDEASEGPIRPLCFNLDIQGGSQFSWTPISIFGNHRTLLPELCRQTDVHLTRGRSSVELTGGGCDGCLQAGSSLVLWSWEVAESGSGNSRTWVLAFLLPRLAFCSLMLKQTQ